MRDEEIWGADVDAEDREDVRRAMSVFGYRPDGKEVGADADEEEEENADAEEVCEQEGEDAPVEVEVPEVVSREEVPKTAGPPGVSPPEVSRSHSTSSASSGTAHSTATTPAASQGTCVGSVSADEGGEKEKMDAASVGVAFDDDSKKDVEVDVVDVVEVEELIPFLVDAVVAQVTANGDPERSAHALDVDVDVAGSAVPMPISCPS